MPEHALSVQTLVIEISPVAVGVRALGAKASGPARRAWVEGEPLEDLSSASRARLSELVRPLLPHGLSSKSEAYVMIHGLGVTAFAHSSPARLGAGSAREAAALALESLAGGSLQEMPHALEIVGSDRASDAKAANIHIVGFAASDSLVAEVFDWVKSLGLTPTGLASGDALHLLSSVRSAMDADSKHSGCARLSIGRSGTVLTVFAGGRLSVVRDLPLGLDALTETLTRPIRTTDAERPALVLRPSEAADLLASAGVPSPGDTLATDPPVEGSAVLPLIQPMLQRIALEVKQSIRFGVPEEHRPAIRLTVAGEGRAVPRLLDALSSLIGVPAGGEEESDAGLLARRLRTFAVVPLQEQQRRSRVRVRASLAAGCATALGFVAFNYAMDSDRIARSRVELAALQQAAEQSAQLQSTRQTVLAAQGALAAFDARVERGAGNRADWPAFLAHLSSITPPEANLQNIECNIANAGPEARLVGRVVPAAGADATQTIAVLLGELSRCPLVRTARLASSARISMGEQNAQSFEIWVHLEPLPSGAMRTADAATEANP